MKFKTTIKCGACVATVTPVLDKVVGAGNWQVDLLAPERTLTVADGKATGGEVTQALAAVGYQAEALA